MKNALHMMQPYIKKIDFKRLSVFVSIIIVVSVIKSFHLTRYLKLDYLHAHIASLQRLVHLYYLPAVGIYICSYSITSACSIPGCTAFLFAAGILFGVFPGLLFATIGATLGATVLFLISRYVIGDWVQENYQNKLVSFNYNISQYGNFYLLMVRLIAVLPFFVVNILSGLTVLSTREFMKMTFIGMLPLALTYTYIGQEFAKLDGLEHFSIFSLFRYSAPIVFAWVMFCIFRIALVPWMYKNFKYEHKSNN